MSQQERLQEEVTVDQQERPEVERKPDKLLVRKEMLELGRNLVEQYETTISDFERLNQLMGRFHTLGQARSPIWDINLYSREGGMGGALYRFVAALEKSGPTVSTQELPYDKLHDMLGEFGEIIHGFVERASYVEASELTDAQWEKRAPASIEATHPEVAQGIKDVRADVVRLRELVSALSERSYALSETQG